MKMSLRTDIVRLAALLLLLASSPPLHAQGARLDIAPERPEPGAIVRLTVSGAHVAGDSIVGIRGTMAGEPLHFVAAGGDYRAIGGVPVESGAAVVARVILERATGRADTLHASIEPPPLPPPSEKLAVAEQFGTPLDAATEARVVAESARVVAVGHRAHELPPLWSAPFLLPRASAITDGFGTGRTFNGRLASRHLGVDFKGAVGEPIRAANRGVVALVDTFYLGGRVVYIDHGDGIVTGYLHLSKPLVAVGDTVARGQTIGLVGATGRVTGPHLHWTARYGALAVNPLDLIGIGQ
jgi:murein DD-endopeptidase MepM/ murein hydrolase activator NlpD